MSDTDGWALLSEQHPPEGIVVETRGENDRGVRELILEKGLFWLTDRSMYVYFVPYEWRVPAKKREFDPEVTFEVWQERDPGYYFARAKNFVTKADAEKVCGMYDEPHFVVKVTTTFEEIS